MSNSLSRKVAEYLSPTGHNGSLRTDFDGLKRDRVLVLNDTIRTVTGAGVFYYDIQDAEGVLTASGLVDRLLAELEDSILEEPHA